MKHESIRTTLLAVIAGVAVALSARADSETVGGVEWQYTLSDGKATITSGDDWSPAIPSSTAGALSIPSTLGGCPVVAIGYGAFYRCSSLTEVTIPDGVTSIGECSFYGCWRLKNVTIPDSITSIGHAAFGACYNLELTTIPEQVTYLGRSAFYDCSLLTNMTILGNITNDLTRDDGSDRSPFARCSGLTTVVFGPKATKVGEYMFYNCEWLTNVVIGTGVTSICDYAFQNCYSLASVTILGNVTNEWNTSGGGPFGNCWDLETVNLGERMTKIGQSMFESCTALKKVTIPDSVTDIGSCAFYKCSSLTDLALGNGVRNIGGDAFANCAGLGTVTIPDSVTNIGSGAFNKCSSLTDLALGNGVRNIGGGAFANCAGLGTVTIPDSVTSIGNSAFYGCSNLTNMAILGNVTNNWETHKLPFSGCTNLATVFLGGKMTAIQGNMFYGCSGLSNVTIGNGVTNIGNNAFYNCTGLRDLSIPDSVTRIGKYSFEYCDGLTNVTIPANATSIESGAFAYCTGLASATILGNITNVWRIDYTTWGWDISPFYGCSNLATVVLGDNVTQIASNMFNRCTGLTSVSIPDSVTEILGNAFYGCSNLASLVVGNNMARIENQAFSGSNLRTLFVPASWEGTERLAATDLPSGCTVIYGQPLVEAVDGVEWCYMVRDGKAFVVAGHYRGNLSIPENLGGYPVAGLWTSAFAVSPALTGITIPEGVESIGGDAFADCKALAEATILGHITNANWPGAHPFSGCTNLGTVVLGENMANIGDYMFYQCRGLTNVAIGNGVTNIGTYAFSSCAGLQSVTIPDSVTRIGNEAFNRCTGLALLEVPLAWRGTTMLANAGVPNGCQIVYRGLAVETVDGVEWGYVVEGDTAVVVNGEYAGELSVPGMLGGYPVARIGTGAFSTCTNLTALVIPDGVTGVDSNAFTGCSALSALEVPAAWYGTTMFANAGVPAGCTVTYRGIEVLAVATEALPVGRVGTPYASTLVAEGGRAPYTWTLETGSLLPDGLEISDTDSGPLGGTPRTAGVFTFTVVLTDAAGVTASKTLTLEIVANPVRVTTDGLPPGSLGNPYSATLEATGCTAPYTWSLETGSVLPEGLEFSDAGSGRLGGIPRAVGIFTFTVVVTDAAGSTASKTLTLEIVNVEWSYSITDGAATVTGAVPAKGHLTIPSTLGGCPVTSIASGAFAFCSNLTGVTLPASVTSIEDRAFKGCTNLSAVCIHDLTAWCGIAFEAPEANPLYYAQHLYLDGDEIVGNLVVPAGVEGIGKYAFCGWNGLTNVTIGNSVMSIGDRAFYLCSGLTEMTIPDSVSRIGERAFFRCTGLTDVTIPAGVTSIGDSAFFGCTGLTEVTILGNVTNEWAYRSCPFGECTNLQTLFLGAHMTKIGTFMFYSCSGLKNMTIPDSVASIGDCAFSGCSGLTSVTIPDSVASIGDSAFSYCRGLTSVTIPDSVTSIGGSAFSYCSGLTSVAIPDGVLLGNYAFRHCSSLTNATFLGNIANDLDHYAYDPFFDSCTNLQTIVLSDKVTQIGPKMFAQCASLKDVTIPASVTSIGDRAFYGCSGLTNVTILGNVTNDWSNSSCPFKGCKNILTILLDGHMTKIGAYMFYDCTGLKNVEISDGVTSIGGSAFSGCRGLMEVKIGDGVASIWGYAFSGCSELTELVLPDSVRNIGDSAFTGCSALAELALPDGVEHVGNWAFRFCSGLATLYVPASWEGTDMLANASVPEGCTVVYRAVPEGVTTSTGVPHSWLDENAADILAANGGDHEAVAKAAAANGRPVWECYVAGLSPTDPAADFKITSISFADGEPVIEWAPDLNAGGTQADRTYVEEGKASMADEWGPRDADSRFFRVRVKLPE